MPIDFSIEPTEWNWNYSQWQQFRGRVNVWACENMGHVKNKINIYLARIISEIPEVAVAGRSWTNLSNCPRLLRSCRLIKSHRIEKVSGQDGCGLLDVGCWGCFGCSTHWQRFNCLLVSTVKSFCDKDITNVHTPLTQMRARIFYLVSVSAS